MGKKSGDTAAVAARAFVLKVAMHCHCRGCVDRVRSAVRDLTLVQGVEAVDQSAVETTGEVRLVATADPERLRRRLRKATRKNVDLLLQLPKPAPKKEAPPQDRRHLVDQLLLPPQYGAWLPNHHQQVPGGGWNNNGSFYGGAAAYPWASPSSSSYPAAAAAAAWAPYAYPPPPAARAAHGGAYYGGAPAWPQGY